MSRTIQAVTKWLPCEIHDFDAIYHDCQQLKKNSTSLIIRISHFLYELEKKISSKFHHSCMQNEIDLQELEDISITMDVMVDQFRKTFSNLAKNHSHPGMISKKNAILLDIIWKLKQKICFFIQELINQIAYLFIYYGEYLLSLILKVSSAYNQLFAMDAKYNMGKNATICTNTCPYLFFPLRKISITRLLQILASNRAELCCHKLIDCLLETYKQYEATENDDNSSDNSSLEIYRALTKHLSPQNRPESPQKTAAEPNSSVFPTIDELIAYEEKNVLDLLETALQIAPTMLGQDSIRKSKNGTKKINAKAQEKVLEYYEQILWGEIGTYLEHIILWWAASPLAARSPHSSQHLREWINAFVPTADVPGMVLAALTCLSDALGVHVTLTAWDQSFRLALVASKTTCNSETGRLFGAVLQDLVMLSNQCEVTPDWVIGAPLEDLPLVEQIPILHRLDHSIHTTRLWAVNETRKIANNWNVDAFFAVTHTDVVNCVAQLNNLRLTDHTIEIEKGGLGVHAQVCGLMRAKLVSEVGVNFAKLKDTPHECVTGLASVCRTISLANLQMIFPEPSYWRRPANQESDQPSAYVDKYLTQILTPVVNATDDPLITNMILELMCESWLDHIYMNRIKFTPGGACQLLTDFRHIETWLDQNASINPQMRIKMRKNEVLRRCEGVGRLLLRSPGEPIKMSEKSKQNSATSGQLMPPEMYVPNQEQWLELRAIKKRILFKAPLCCGKI